MDVSGTALVMFLGAVADVTVVVVVDTWAAAERIEGDIAPVVVLDFAWKVGLLRARKAEKKLAKKGRWVGIIVSIEDVGRQCSVDGLRKLERRLYVVLVVNMYCVFLPNLSQSRIRLPPSLYAIKSYLPTLLHGCHCTRQV